MDWTDLKAYVGASDMDDTYVEECWLTAQDMVAAYVKSAQVPSHILKRGYMEVGSELYHRRSSPMGITQYASSDGSAIRVARDPLIGVYPILNRYMTRFA